MTKRKQVVQTVLGRFRDMAWEIVSFSQLESFRFGKSRHLQRIAETNSHPAKRKRKMLQGLSWAASNLKRKIPRPASLQ